MPRLPVSDLVQDAVCDVLSAALADLHSGALDALHQPVYAGHAPTGAVLPYVSYQDSGESAGRTFGHATQGDDQLACLASGPGGRDAKRLYARVASALNGVTLTLANGATVRGSCALITVADDAGDLSGLTVRAIVRYTWHVTGGL